MNFEVQLNALYRIAGYSTWFINGILILYHITVWKLKPKTKILPNFIPSFLSFV